MKSRLLMSYSISARLTFMFAAAALCLLALSEGSLYFMLSRNVMEQGRRFLADKLSVLQLILQNQPGKMEPLREEVQWETGARLHARFFSRVLGSSGNVIIETQGMSAIFLDAPFPGPASGGTDFQRGVIWRPEGEKCYLLGSTAAQEGGAGGPWRRLQVAVDISDSDELLEDYRRNMGLSLAAGLVVAVFLGYFSARRGLEPLVSMEKKAREITAERLHERMANETWPKELLALASSFDAMLARLEESFVRLSAFSADLAHDLRTPLNNCLGELEVALSKQREPEEYRRALGSALEDLTKLSRMMDNLLFLARADSSQAKADKCWLDAEKEVAAICGLYEAVAEEGGVVLDQRGEARVYADPLLLKRALGNVLSNALRLSPRGSLVSISAREAQGGAVVEISDSGPGIPEDELPLIFTRFYRPAKSREEHPQGLGLGLAIVKSIMDLHQGSVSAQSENNKGARFILFFPNPT